MPTERAQRLDRLAAAVRILNERGEVVTHSNLASSAQRTWGTSIYTSREYVEDCIKTGRIKANDGRLYPNTEQPPEEVK